MDFKHSKILIDLVEQLNIMEQKSKDSIRAQDCGIHKSPYYLEVVFEDHS